MDPEGKVAFVTGGVSGIGLSLVKVLLENGAKVAICDRNAQALEQLQQEITKKYGDNKAIFIQMDITNEATFADAFKKTKSHFGQLDIVVNNAGIFDDTQWENEIEINVKGTIRGTLLALEHMSKAKGGNGGVIINSGSIAGLDFFCPVPMYSSTKLFIASFSRCFGMDFHYNQTGVRVLCICPGTTVTPLMVVCHKTTYDPSWSDYAEQRVKETIYGTPEQVAASYLQLIRTAKSGTVWVSEGDETYEVVIPTREEMRVKK